jgi:hypothetical protein
MHKLGGVQPADSMRWQAWLGAEQSYGIAHNLIPRLRAVRITGRSIMPPGVDDFTPRNVRQIVTWRSRVPTPARPVRGWSNSYLRHVLADFAKCPCRLKHCQVHEPVEAMANKVADEELRWRESANRAGMPWPDDRRSLSRRETCWTCGIAQRACVLIWRL